MPDDMQLKKLALSVGMASGALGIPVAGVAEMLAAGLQPEHVDLSTNSAGSWLSAELPVAAFYTPALVDGLVDRGWMDSKDRALLDRWLAVMIPAEGRLRFTAHDEGAAVRVVLWTAVGLPPASVVAHLVDQGFISAEVGESLGEAVTLFEAPYCQHVGLALGGGEPPRIHLSLQRIYDGEHRGRVSLAALALAQHLGVSERQRTWAHQVLDAFAHRPDNLLRAELSVTADALLPRLELGIHDVGHDSAMRVMLQFAEDKSVAPRLGRFSAAVAPDADTVHWLWLGLHDGEPPRIAVTLRAE